MSTNQIPQIWYDAKGGYWLRSSETGNRFLNLDSGQIKRHLRRAGLQSEKTGDRSLSEIDMALSKAELERYVDYAGPLAGHRVGHFTTADGKKVLVTSEADPAVFEKSTASPDKWPFLRGYLNALLDGGEQYSAFLTWLGFAVRSLRHRDFRPGQMIALAGPPGCGKSFLHQVITMILGGRVGKPYLWMTAKTAFNQDLAESESLVIEDEQGHTDIRTRLAFKATIKQLTVNEDLHVHGKGLKGLVLPTYRRVHASLNEEPENLMILPPMDEDLAGKMMLFRCYDATGKLSEDRTENKDRARAELPSLRAFLDKLRCPASVRDPRFGVRSHHDPGLLESISGLAPETRLLQLIDEVIWTKARRREEPEFTASADEIEKELRGSAFHFAVDRLLVFPSAAGTYLGRLSKKFPTRFERITRQGKACWRLKP